MTSGCWNAFLISWAQTEIDGLEAAPVLNLAVGSSWSWRGDAVATGPLTFDPVDAEAVRADARRKQAAKAVHRLVDRALCEDGAGNCAQLDSHFVLSDGAQSYEATLINVGRGVPPLLMFMGALPPRLAELWVAHHTLGAAPQVEGDPDDSGVICFTPGTRVATPQGPKAVETLIPGDKVLTMDNGPQPIEWIGRRQMSGARLFAMPRLRPIRISAGALGLDRPDETLLVSPEHRLLVSGAVARELFGTPEVLVAARDLIDHQRIRTASDQREVTYIHLMLPQHNIVWANGIATESFHPANTALASLNARDLSRLLTRYPALTFDPHSYGGFARRNLSGSEAAQFAQVA
jgi:hypothetical protein